MTISQQYWVLCLTLQDGRTIKFKRLEAQFIPLDTQRALVLVSNPDRALGGVEDELVPKEEPLQEISYRLGAIAGDGDIFEEDFIHKFKGEVVLAGTAIESRNGPLFRPHALADLLNAKKLGRATGVQFVA